MSAPHDFTPWLDAVTFHVDGTPVVQLCKVVTDGGVCGLPYSDPVHLPKSTAGDELPTIADGPWKGWREVGATAG